jgi:hypothetical protein
MVFLPATFAAVSFFSKPLINFLIIKIFYQGFFGMNVGEITPSTNGTLWQYFSVAVPLTLLTAWVIIAFQSKYIIPKLEKKSFWKRLAWPFFLSYFFMFSKKNDPPEELPQAPDISRWRT